MAIFGRTESQGGVGALVTFGRLFLKVRTLVETMCLDSLDFALQIPGSSDAHDAADDGVNATDGIGSHMVPRIMGQTPLNSVEAAVCVDAAAAAAARR